VQACAVALEPPPKLRDTLGRALTQRARRAHHLTPPRQRRLGVGAGAAVLLAPRALQRGGELERVLVLRLDDLRANGVGKTLGQPPRRRLRLGRVARDGVVDRHRRADGDERRGHAERPGRLIDETDGEKAHAVTPAVGLSAEQQAGGARAQRQECWNWLSAALGKNQDRAARAQVRDGRREHRLVFSRIVARLGAAVHRQRADGAQERPDERMPEQRRVGEHGDAARERAHDEHRIHERVVVIGGDDQRAVRRDALGAHDVHAPIEQPQQ